MKKLLLSTIAFAFFTVLTHAQVGGCAPTGDCTGINNHINAVSFGNVIHRNNVCATGGYMNHSDSSFFYGQPGELYTAYVDWALYNNHYAVMWIDWNKNNDFTDAGEIYRMPFSDAANIGGTVEVEIPIGQQVGDSLFMRVGVMSNQGVGVEDPCFGARSSEGGVTLTFVAFREVEDYRLIITDVPPTDYCAVDGSNCDDYIDLVNFPGDNQTINNISACDGYSDYTDQIADVTAGEVYVVLISRFTNIIEGITAIHIDWNNDFDFDDQDEEYISDVSPNTTDRNVVVTVPAEAEIGAHRMRITGGDLNNTYCGTIALGEAEDYTIQVGNPVQCATHKTPTDDQQNLCTNNVTLTWSPPIVGSAPTGYKVHLGTDLAATSEVNGQDVALDTNYVYTTALAANTKYYWKIIAYDIDGDASGCKVDSFTTAASVDPSIDEILLGGIDVDSTAVCANIDLAILAKISGGTLPLTYGWTGDDINLDDNAALDPIFNASVGDQTYKLRFTIVDDNNCVARDSVKVYVKVGPDAGTLAADKSAVCAGETVTLSLTGYNETITDWEKAEGVNPYASISYIQDVLATTITEETKFKVLLSNGECAAESNEVTITRKLDPVEPAITVTPSNTVCEGETVTLTAIPSTDIVWNDANSSTTSDIAVTDGGAYNVTYTDPTSGCSSTSDNEVITFNALPNEPTIAVSGLQCEGNTVTLTATPGTDIVWNDASNSTTASIDVTTDGTYSVTYTDPTTSCTAISANENLVFNAYPAAPIIEQSGDSLITNPSQVVNWLDASGNVVATGASYSPDRTPLQTFTAVVVDGNGCESDVSNEVAYDHTVSIKTIETSTFNIYPNPAINIVIVNVADANMAGAYEMKDMSGRTIKTIQIPVGETEIDLSTMDSGIYLIQHTSGVAVRFVKQ